jgi:peroxiredoxin
MVKKLLIIFLIFIIGVFSIYFVISQFFKGIAPAEITFELEEITEELQKIDYSAPDFALFNIEGEEVKFSDYKDKIILLSFWTTWNPAALDQLVILESYYQEIKDSRDIVLLTINNQEDKSVVSNFIRRGKYLLPVLLDEDGAVGELYEINTLPATYFINKEGKVKEIYIGVLSKEEINKKVERLYQK